MSYSSCMRYVNYISASAKFIEGWGEINCQLPASDQFTTLPELWNVHFINKVFSHTKLYKIFSHTKFFSQKNMHISNISAHILAEIYKKKRPWIKNADNS